MEKAVATTGANPRAPGPRRHGAPGRPRGPAPGPGPARKKTIIAGHGTVGTYGTEAELIAASSACVKALFVLPPTSGYVNPCSC